MKRIKLLLLVTIVLILTGCKATYQVEIYNNEIHEEIDIIDPTAISAEDNRDKIYESVEKNAIIDALNRGFKPYTNKKDNTFSLKAKTTFTFDEFKEEMYYDGTCCRHIDFSFNDEYITYRALGYIQWIENYKDIDEIDIVIKSNHKLVETNADEIKRNTYIWHINKDNYKEELPMVKLHRNKYVFNYENEFVKKVLLICGITGIILIVGFVSYKIAVKKIDKTNEI